MPKVLLVDDDIAEISAVKRAIARAGHQAVLATTSADALIALAHSSPALLVVGSTCEDGEALRQFAEAEEARGIPLVVLGETERAPDGARQLARPLDPSQLAEHLAAAIRGAPPAPPPSPAPQQARKAAADALRARAEELRRGAAPSSSADPDDPGLEAILRRAEEAERAHAAEASARSARPSCASEERAPGRSAPSARERAALRADLAGELDRLVRQVDEDRQSSSERLRTEVDRAATERATAARQRQEADARRRQEEEVRRRAEDEAQRRDAEEEQLRTAIASARAEMETLRRKAEDEGRRRAQAEAEIARLAREAERRADGIAQAAPSESPAYAPTRADPAPDSAEEAARRRVAALRQRSGASARPEAHAPPPEPPVPAAAEPAQPPLRAPPPELRAGTLADLPAPRLLALAARDEVSGRFDFEGEASRSIYLENGCVVGATSSDPAERVEELALRLGLVTREQHRHAASAAAPLATRRAALVLLERGFLKPTELTGLVRRRTEEVVFGVFGEPGARFGWTAAEVPADERTTLERTTLALAVEGVRRRWLTQDVDAVLGGPGTLLSPVPAGPAPAELALSREERRAVGLADGLRTLDEIVAASPLDPLSTRQTLAALVLVGALAVRTFLSGRPAAATTAAIDLARVWDKLDQVRRADYFTVLGVGRHCTPHEVREAFERLRAELDPSRYQGVQEEGLERKLDEILQVVADARDVLVDDRLRDEYLRGLGE